MLYCQAFHLHMAKIFLNYLWPEAAKRQNLIKSTGALESLNNALHIYTGQFNDPIALYYKDLKKWEL